jgi:hypothetical protein
VWLKNLVVSEFESASCLLVSSVQARACCSCASQHSHVPALDSAAKCMKTRPKRAQPVQLHTHSIARLQIGEGLTCSETRVKF